MAIELISRPIGHKLNGTDVSANIIDDGTGDALVYTGSAHGLADGDYVYIESNFDSYNGYFYVDSTAYDSFKIKTSENGEYVQYVQDAEISYRTSVVNHGFQCVHLPIAYELQSDLWPNNVAEEAYTPTTIVSQENVNGYTQLNLDTALDNPQALNYIELIGGALDGPYQIIEVVQPWAIVINLAYDATNVFTAYQVVNYYNNYAINVNVYSGYPAGHRWASEKPFELAATLKFIPDSNGKIKFSIAEILKGYIQTRNNLTLDTLPNNTDFSTGFYIEYFETYDVSDGEVITTFMGEVTTDTFQGVAVNAMLPFKSLDSGFMSEYINGDTYLARWLTLFDRPIAVVDRFFDISFLNPYNLFDIQIIKNGVLFQTILNPGFGVIRVPFTPSQGEIEYCLQARIDGEIAITLPALSSGINEGSGTLNWSIDSTPSLASGGAPINTSKILSYPLTFLPGLTYVFSMNFTTGDLGNLIFVALDGDGDIVTQDNNLVPTAGTFTRTSTFVAEGSMVGYGFYSILGSFESISINSVSAVAQADDITITEEICIDVVEECAGTFVNDELRITEGGLFRELE